MYRLRMLFTASDRGSPVGLSLSTLEPRAESSWTSTIGLVPSLSRMFSIALSITETRSSSDFTVSTYRDVTGETEENVIF